MAGRFFFFLWLILRISGGLTFKTHFDFKINYPGLCEYRACSFCLLFTPPAPKLQFLLLLLLEETSGFNYSSAAYFAVWSQSQIHEKDLILSKGKTLLDNTYLTADTAGINNNNTKIWV